jgi:hypothetical protein
MWRQLLEFEKFQLVACVVGPPVSVLAVIVNAMDRQWFRVTAQAILVCWFICYPYKLASRGRGKGEPGSHNSRATRPGCWRDAFQNELDADGLCIECRFGFTTQTPATRIITGMVAPPAGAAGNRTRRIKRGDLRKCWI